MTSSRACVMFSSLEAGVDICREPKCYGRLAVLQPLQRQVRPQKGFDVKLHFMITGGIVQASGYSWGA
ncbi:unnamed protein product [Peronospora destructor]|uniref:Uncharacterized protein n=1 Tax=Peronospora destructor TaxID=86335 RepID=A0AAV0V3K0_9STRA|nr:unnamed protein product [Peronospora destructor]